MASLRLLFATGCRVVQQADSAHVMAWHCFRTVIRPRMKELGSPPSPEKHDEKVSFGSSSISAKAVMRATARRS